MIADMTADTPKTQGVSLLILPPLICSCVAASENVYGLANARSTLEAAYGSLTILFPAQVVCLVDTTLVVCNSTSVEVA